MASAVLLDCPPGRYGANCNEICSFHCQNTCDQYTGVCLNGCSPGYKMPYCRESKNYYNVLCRSIYKYI